MTSIPFDTLGASKRLGSAGLQKDMAEAIVDVVRRQAENTVHLATKTDLALLERRFDGLERRFDDLQKLVFASMVFNLAGFHAVGGFLFAVLK